LAKFNGFEYLYYVFLRICSFGSIV
jgi:hypothetical protein